MYRNCSPPSQVPARLALNIQFPNSFFFGFLFLLGSSSVNCQYDCQEKEAADGAGVMMAMDKSQVEGDPITRQEGARISLKGYLKF